MKKRKGTNRSNVSDEPQKRRPKRQQKGSQNSQDLTIYGLHAVRAALENPARRCLSLSASRNALLELADILPAHPSLRVTETSIETLNGLVRPGTVHQGVLLRVAPLPEPDLADIIATGRPLIVLDQVTDPRNIGAILRTATVFGAGAVILPRQNSPLPAGALAKTASGALEHMPLVSVANLARCLKQLNKSGYLTLGLDEQGEMLMSQTPRNSPVALVMGAEGKGLRRLSKENCTYLVRLPNAVTDSGAEFATLNVATATAVSLYELVR